MPVLMYVFSSFVLVFLASTTYWLWTLGTPIYLLALNVALFLYTLASVGSSIAYERRRKKINAKIDHLINEYYATFFHECKDECKSCPIAPICGAFRSNNDEQKIQ